MKKIIFIGTFLFLALVPKLFCSTAMDEYLKGLELFKEKQYEQALTLFNNAIELDPNMWQAYEYAGESYYNLGDAKTAMVLVEKSLRLNPENVELSDFASDMRGKEAQSQNGQTNVPGISNTEKNEKNPTPPQIKELGGWAKLYFGGGFNSQGDINNAVNAWNQDSTAPIGVTTSAAAGNGLFHLGGEFGCNVDPNNGLAVAGTYWNTEFFDNNNTFYNGNPQILNEMLLPIAINLDLSYYHFWPAPDGRFYVKGSVGYWLANVQYFQNFPSPNTSNIDGNLYGGGLGFGLEAGYEFRVFDNEALGFYVKGQYATISSISGFPDGYSGKAVLAVLPNQTIGVVSPSAIGSNGTRYAVLDFSGIDLGVSFIFYLWLVLSCLLFMSSLIQGFHESFHILGARNSEFVVKNEKRDAVDPYVIGFFFGPSYLFLKLIPF
jgi:tetratricopeptide (TPR) repeat protein